MFILMTRGYEYNDEIEVAESGGSPFKSFKTKEKAQLALKEKLVNWIKTADIKNYYYDPMDFFKYKNKIAQRIIDQMLMRAAVEWGDIDMSKLTEEEIEALALDIAEENAPFYIEECD